MRIKAQVVAGFVEVTVPRALRFPELEQFSDGHETVPFPLELSNGFLEHERRSLGHPIGMEQDNRAGPHLPGHPVHGRQVDAVPQRAGHAAYGRSSF